MFTVTVAGDGDGDGLGDGLGAPGVLPPQLQSASAPKMATPAPDSNGERIPDEPSLVEQLVDDRKKSKRNTRRISLKIDEMYRPVLQRP